MDDSDETICDDVDDPTILSQSQVSPSIIARSDDLDKKAPAECELKTTGDVDGSPEYLPPSAKIKRIASKEMPSLDQGSSKSATTASKEMSAAEKLASIREKQEKIEQMLVLLESSVKRGITPKENPIFAEVKHLMTTAKNQLADFTRDQQQQRQGIANSSNAEPGSQEGSSSQWTPQTKHKLFELAAQQKELLTLFQCHKKQLDKIQALKQKARSATCIKHIIPAVEAHCKSKRWVNVQQEIMDNTQQPSLVKSLCASNTNPLVVTTCENTIPNITTKQGNEISVSKHTSIPLMNVPSSHAENSCRAIHSQPLVTSAVKQVTASQTPVTLFHHVSSANFTTPSAISQPRVQNVVLTAGQLYQVGDRQIYVLPRGLPVTPTFVVTQAAQVTAKLTSTTVTYTTLATPETGLNPSLSVTKSAQGHLLNTVVSLPSTAVSWHSQISQNSSQVTNNGTAVPSCNVILPNLDNSSCSYVSLPASTARTVNNSLALQNAPPTTVCNSGSHVDKHTSHSNHKAPISCAASESARTVSQLHKSARLQSQHSISTHNDAGVQSLSQAAMTTEPIALKGTAVQSRTLQRRGSFGNDLPDVKTLLNHSVIQAGPNVLSMQYEGRNFEASLRSNGLIESAGGETFRTPMAWMRAVTGSWNNVKQSQAYKMVCYKGRPLALFTIPSTNTETCQNRGKGNDSVATRGIQEGAGSNVLPCNKCGQVKTRKKAGLLTCWEDIARLLTDCKVIPIGKDELIPTDSFLPAHFWDSTSEVDIPASVLEEVDF